MLPRSMESTAETRVATRRIQHLLMAPEVKGTGHLLVDGPAGDDAKPKDQSLVLKMEHACFTWSDDNPHVTPMVQEPHVSQGSHTLGEGLPLVQGQGEATPQVTVSDVSLSVKTGEVVIILGPVGCGKSTLLEGILGKNGPLLIVPSIHLYL